MGLFSKKEAQYELPAKLESLLKMALEDGEITEKELAVLRNEAQKHDISEAELDMFIESRLNKKVDKSSESVISSEEVNSIINSNQYSANDTVEQTFQKYEILCDYTTKKLEKSDREKLHRAQLTFISSIIAPLDKETMLNLIAHTLPYTRKKLSSKALKTAANIGKIVMKTISVTAKVATLGMAGKVVDNLDELTQKAIVTNSEELANAWRSKIESLLEDAKNLVGGLFSGDRQFKTKLSELSEQYKQYK